MIICNNKATTLVIANIQCQQRSSFYYTEVIQQRSFTSGKKVMHGNCDIDQLKFSFLHTLLYFCFNLTTVLFQFSLFYTQEKFAISTIVHELFSVL